MIVVYPYHGYSPFYTSLPKVPSSPSAPFLSKAISPVIPAGQAFLRTKFLYHWQHPRTESSNSFYTHYSALTFF